MAREKVRVSDLSFLIICLERNWNTLARRVVQDAEILRDQGCKVILCCEEETTLYEQAKAAHITTRTIRLVGRKYLSYFYQYLEFRKMIKEEEINIVHSYGFNALPGVGLTLFKNMAIPFIYTCNEDLTLKYQSFWHDYFMKRIDYTVTFTNSLREEIVSVLKIPDRKVMTFGVGVDTGQFVPGGHQESDTWKVCTFIQRDQRNLKRFEAFVRCVEYILRDSDSVLEKKFLFTFLSDIPWSEHPLYQQLKSMILERGIEHNVTFATKKLHGLSFHDQNLYVGVFNDEVFNDVELLATVHQTPILLPRTSARKQILLQRDIGSTYMDQDVREMKQKIMMLLSQYRYTQNQFEDSTEKLISFHHFERYNEQLQHLYERSLIKRLRFAHAKKQF